jgi:hypothetical protein
MIQSNVQLGSSSFFYNFDANLSTSNLWRCSFWSSQASLITLIVPSIRNLASSEEIKNVIDEELASLTDKERSDALAHFAPGSDGYASAAWKVKVEKVIAMYLP